jgi:hypothetical protein
MRIFDCDQDQEKMKGTHGFGYDTEFGTGTGYGRGNGGGPCDGILSDCNGLGDVCGRGHGNGMYETNYGFPESCNKIFEIPKLAGTFGLEVYD